MKKIRSIKNSGFTLIEIMLVVTLIAILSFIAVPKFVDLLTRSKEATIKSKTGNLRSALSIYYSDTQTFPGDLVLALTTDEKYLKEIPAIAIPAVSDQSNPGHAENSSVTSIEDDFATGAWVYTDVSGTGSVFINCTHKDSKAVVWSSF